MSSFAYQVNYALPPRDPQEMWIFNAVYQDANGGTPFTFRFDFDHTHDFDLRAGEQHAFLWNDTGSACFKFNVEGEPGNTAGELGIQLQPVSTLSNPEQFSLVFHLRPDRQGTSPFTMRDDFVSFPAVYALSALSQSPTAGAGATGLAVTPEPSSGVLMVSALLIAIFCRCRKRTQGVETTA
jgi:hypothetical protein